MSEECVLVDCHQHHIAAAVAIIRYATTTTTSVKPFTPAAATATKAGQRLDDNNVCDMGVKCG